MNVEHAAAIKTVRKLAPYASRAACWSGGLSSATSVAECRILVMSCALSSILSYEW